MSMTGQEKAAVLLAALTPELRQQVLERLGQLGQQLRERLRALEHRPPDQEVVRAVTGEFQLALHGAESQRQPHWQAVGAALKARAAYGGRGGGTGSAPADSDESTPGDAEDLPGLIRSIQSVEPGRVVKVLANESPGAIAIVLQLLDPGYAARVIGELSPELAASVSQRLLLRRPAPQGVVAQILRAVVARLRAEQTPAHGPNNERFLWLAQALRRMPAAARVTLLRTLDARSPDLADALRRSVYRVEDLVSIPDRLLRRVIQKLDARALAAVLSTADSLVRSKVLRVLPERVRSVVEEALGTESFDEAAVTAAVQRLVETICELEQRGEEVLPQS